MVKTRGFEPEDIGSIPVMSSPLLISLKILIKKF